MPATSQAYSLIYSTLDQQAHLWAFVDNFRLFGLLALCGIPLIFLFKRVQQGQAGGGGRALNDNRCIFWKMNEIRA